MRRLVKTLLEALCRVLFTYECEGADRIPERGPAIVAANHPSYLDPILLSLEVSRPIRFMAWDALFRVPLVGALLDAFGAFPVDVRRGQGKHAYREAKSLIEAGEVVGIFPEGKRSHTGWLEEDLREGAARLALETGAPVIPASIAGAFRAWPYTRPLPRPTRIKVRFHEPIDPKAYGDLNEAEAISALLKRLRERVERSLLPGVKADLRLSVLYTMPAPFPRLFEFVPALLVAVLVFWKSHSRLAMAPAYAYILYLILDHYVIPQRRVLKWIRNVSSVVFLFAVSPIVLRVLGLPEPPAREALLVMIAGALFPYLYEHGRTVLAFIRGLVATIVIAGAAYALVPAPFGPHLALSLFAAAFAWEWRTVFWRYATPLLLSYGVYCVWIMGPSPRVLPHAMAGLLGWLTTRIFPNRSESDHPERHSLEGLGLRD